ncbi:MAG TPA: fibronectin type III domain-containing protein [Thermoanaerobaculia bacterium]|nr:fibronectin type III domain-containing protein [Thermoanaerobaculia bacterium]
MRKLLLSLLLPLLLPVTTQALQFSSAFPVTNTRYGTVAGEGRLASNGNDVFLFWISGGSVRVTKLVAGVKRVGQSVLSTTGTTIDDFDVLWNGSNFIVAATNGTNIVARLVDRTGEPAGIEFVMNGNAFGPRLAFNGSTLLLVHRSYGFSGVASLPLTKNGAPAGFGGQAVQLMGNSFAVTSNGTGFMAISASFQNVSLIRFDANGVINDRYELAGAATPGTREVAIASNGAKYLASWFEDGVGGIATIADDSGAHLRIPFANESGATYEGPSAVWSGSDYVLAYVRHAVSGSTLQSVHFDTQAAPTIADPEQPAAPSRNATALLSKAGRVLVAWNRGEDAVVDELPVDTVPDAWSTYGAATQTLLATTTSFADATLVVWSERVNGASSIRFGLRELNGNWSERLLANAGTTRAIAGTDGANFVIVVAEADRTSTAYRVDARGVLSGRTTKIPFEATGVAWNGQRYGIVGERAGAEQAWNNEVVAATLDANGTLSATTLLREVDDTGTSDEPRIVSNGQNFLAAWMATDNPICPFPCIVGTGVEGTRLGGDLTRLDAEDLAIAPRSAVTSAPALAWNGTAYVVAWDDYLTMNVSFVSPGGVVTQMLLADTKTYARYPQAVTFSQDHSVLVVWSDPGNGLFGVQPYSPRHRFARVDPNGVVIDSGTILDDASPNFALTSTSYDGFYFRDATWTEAPHHGASRVILRVTPQSGIGPLTPPNPPSVTAHVEGNRMIVEWSEATFASGYRIEYRVADGAWNEVAAWYDGQTFRASLSMPDNTAFRVRGFNNGGVSAPSAPTPALRLNTPKRRAVR